MVKNILLSALMLFTSKAYTMLYSDIQLMMPIERSVLAQSMIEVAQAYETIGHAKKSQEYYQVALKVYPMGDQAHALAKKLDITLNDDQTFHYFVEEGLRFYNQKDLKQALQSFFMADQIKATLNLYQNIANVYRSLGNEKKASEYEELSKGLIE